MQIEHILYIYIIYILYHVYYIINITIKNITILQRTLTIHTWLSLCVIRAPLNPP